MECVKLCIQLTGWISQTVFIASNLVLFVLSLTGNSLVMYLVWTKSALRSPTYFLLSFLALSDVFTSLFGQLSYCISVTILNDISCTTEKMIGFFSASSCTCSLLLLSLIARDRYLHVSKQQDYPNHTSIRFSIIAPIISYLLGMLIASLFTFDVRAIRISSTFAFSIFGTSSFIYICIKARQINRIVVDHSKHMQASCLSRSTLQENISIRYNNIEKAVNRSIFSVIILFFVSWTPVIVLMAIFSVHIFFNKPISDGYRIALAWGSTVSYFNGAFNPIIYGYRCDAIGQQIRRIMRKVTGSKNRVVSSSSQVETLDINVNAPKENPTNQRLKSSNQSTAFHYK